MQRMQRSFVVLSLVASALAVVPALGREPAPAETERRERSAQGGKIDLSGGWQLLLPAGFEHRIQLVRENERDYRWKADGLNFSGKYELKDGRLVIIEPQEPRLAGFAWKIHSPHLLFLVEEPAGTGAHYCGAVLFRSADVAPRDGAR